MTVLEMKVEALMKCVDQGAFEKAMAEIGATSDMTKCTVDTLHREIRVHLAALGVPAHLKGHRYIVYAIELGVTNEDILDAITCELYPAVAKRCNTTPSRVERAIRHAVETAWSRGDLDVLNQYFGNTISNTKGKPTNSEFIAQLANIIRDRVG